MINRINLFIPKIEYANLNKRFFTVPTLYLKHLPKFNSGSIKQINIALNILDHKPLIFDKKVKGIIEVVKDIDLHSYLNLDNFKKLNFS